MELYLQFGWGMMEHCRVLVSSWGGGTVILSPRDLELIQLPSFATSITRLPNGEVLLDPQFYLPDSDHERLCSHTYWPDQYQTGLFWQGAQLNTLLVRLLQLNQQCGSSAFILPGRLAAAVDDDWLNIQQMTLEAARALDTQLPLISTIALSSDATRTESQIVDLLERAADWNADGYYIVCEHPNGSYLVEDATWLANITDLVAGLRLRGAHVIVGYCNHQMLIAASAGANAIASGTWMNVRSFSSDKFRTAPEDEVKQKAKWYYCPQALSEYKLPLLDMARTQGLLDQMAPVPEFDSGQVAALFSGVQPTTVPFPEQTAFRHYLLSLYRQVQLARAGSFDETVQRHDDSLNAAEALLGTLSGSRITGQLRDFSEIVAINRVVLGSLITRRGALLRRNWNNL